LNNGPIVGSPRALGSRKGLRIVKGSKSSESLILKSEARFSERVLLIVSKWFRGVDRVCACKEIGKDVVWLAGQINWLAVGPFGRYLACG